MFLCMSHPSTCSIHIPTQDAIVSAILCSSPTLCSLRQKLVASKVSWDNSGSNSKKLLSYHDSKYKGRIFEWIFSSSEASGLASPGSLDLPPIVPKCLPRSRYNVLTQHLQAVNNRGSPFISISFIYRRKYD